MIPKEKASKLVLAFAEINMPSMCNYAMIGRMTAKECALIAVQYEYAAKIKAYSELEEFCPDVAMQAIFYAQKELDQVKQEIEAL